MDYSIHLDLDQAGIFPAMKKSLFRATNSETSPSIFNFSNTTTHHLCHHDISSFLRYPSTLVGLLDIYNSITLFFLSQHILFDFLKNVKDKKASELTET